MSIVAVRPCALVPAAGLGRKGISVRNSNTCTFSQIIIIDPTQAGRKRGTSRRPATETDKDGVFLPNELVPLPDV